MQKVRFFSLVLVCLLSTSLAWSNENSSLYGLKIDEPFQTINCRTVPFCAVAPDKREKTTRIENSLYEKIPVGGVSAEAIYFLGMINYGWDNGLEHWGWHPEIRDVRNDQIHIGTEIGELEILYLDGTSDRLPIVTGATSWFFKHWAIIRDGKGIYDNKAIREPFASRPEYAKVLDQSMKLKESSKIGSDAISYAHYYLAVKPRQKKIDSVIIHNNQSLRGRPLISAITVLTSKPAENLHSFDKQEVDCKDLKTSIESSKKQDFSKELKALADTLYTKESDLPKKVELIDFHENLDATRIIFKGSVFADMLSNIWVANLTEINEKFNPVTGFFHESAVDGPYYGSYRGIGTWVPLGVYNSGAFGRSSDHFATLAIRCINNDQRLTSYVDFCDNYLYFYRKNHDPNQGPPNARLDIDKWPEDAPPHWGFVMQNPCNPPWPINELQGEEEMDGHGATIIGRWSTWRMLGLPNDLWLTGPRDHVYGKSRYDSTRDAANFICWFMDYTGMDVIYSEGEVTGWGARLPDGVFALVPKGMPEETDLEKIRRNYANSDMYEPYPSYACLTALRCSAQMADAVGDTKNAKKWRDHADRIQTAMVRLLAVGEHGSRVWRQSRYSILPSLQDSLVQAWMSFYYDGIDPKKLDPEMTGITLNTFNRQINLKPKHKPVIAMGYGIGWLTKSALVLDQMDDAGKLICNIAKYSYDKNMNYVDKQRGIDWRKHQWIIPEGTNIMPDGSWYRISDLGNGANQGPAMHALELCAGIDDTNPKDLKILPRIVDPISELEVKDFFVLVPDGDGLTKARVNYSYNRKKSTFELLSDTMLPKLSVRMGPYGSNEASKIIADIKCSKDSTSRLEVSGKYKGQPASWIWFEDIKDVSSLKIASKKD